MHWLLNLSRTNERHVPATVAEQLRQAMDHRARVELVPVHGGAEARPFVTTIQALDDDGVIVALPTLGGSVRPLGRFESYQMTVDHPQKPLTGPTGTLGRMRYRTPNGTSHPGYRLTYPDALYPIERRRDVRKVLGGDQLREASITIAGRKNPVIGLVEDISARGLRVRCRSHVTNDLANAEGLLRVELAPPIGLLAESVRVIGVESCPQTGEMMLRATFHQPVEAIARALDGACSAMRRAPKG